MTGFPVEDKRRLEQIKLDFHRADVQTRGRKKGFEGHKAFAAYATSHNAEDFEKSRLANAERASIEQRVASAPSNAK